MYLNYYVGLTMEKPKIAFIDDERRILKSLKMFFRQTHDVFITTDADELMTYIKNNDVKVVISDQRMPDIKGTEVLEKVKHLSPSTVRILLTGYADLNAIADSVNSGEIYRYITKPWQNEDLKKIVDKATSIAETMKDIDFTYIEDSGCSDKFVLVLDDSEETYLQMKKYFGPIYNLHWADSLDKAAKLMAKHNFAVAVSDVELDGEDITPIVYELKSIRPELMMLMITEYKDAHMLIDLINKGQIFRCLPRPTNLSILGVSLDRAYQHHLRMVNEPSLAVLHEVEAVPEDEKISFSSRIKSFLSLFIRFKRRPV